MTTTVPHRSVRRIRGWAVKAYPDRATATRIAHWSEQLARCGVATPAGHTLGTYVRFPWVDGRSGRSVIGDAVRGNARNRQSLREVMTTVLAPLVTLHATPPPRGVAHVDPWLRVRPRIAALGTSREPSHRDIGAAAVGLIDRVQPFLATVASAGGLVHGDFHPGQLIHASGSTPPVILDMDDLAVGPHEVDLGNLTANLATQSPALDDDVDRAIPRWHDIIDGAYRSAGGPDVDREHLAAFTVTALVRRALKALERGATPTDANRVLAAALRVSRALPTPSVDR